MNTNTGQGAALNKKQIPTPGALFGYSHLYGGVPEGWPSMFVFQKATLGHLKFRRSCPTTKRHGSG